MPVMMGNDRSPYDLTMRAEQGHALRIPAAALLAASDASATLRLALLRFVHVLMVQMGRSIVSSLAHPIDRRMARWILLYHDRVRADDDQHAIRALRARIVVQDRAKLMLLAGDTYGRPEQEYRRLLRSTAEA